MSEKHQCLRGMRDIGPNTTSRLSYIESIFTQLAQANGYQEVSFPILESTELFQKSIGIETDIVGQEMYTFEDRNQSMVTLRPEGTAGCLRSCLANGLIQRSKEKVFYRGPMFRRERPQKGRFRQFQHFGIEVYGYPSGLIDVELIELTHQAWQALQIDSIELHVNFLGSIDTRKRYHQILSEYWQANLSILTDDEQKRATENPLRLLDSKNPELKDIIANAPSIKDALSSSERAEYEAILSNLKILGIPYIESNKLVRGLDYYSHFIFEWICPNLGAQSTVCGGGRYDPLVQSQGYDFPAVGFAAGIDRIEAVMPQIDPISKGIYICAQEEQPLTDHLVMINQLRAQRIPLFFDMSHGKIKNKISQANQRGFAYIAILQPAEQIKIIDLTIDESTVIPSADWINWCTNHFGEQ